MRKIKKLIFVLLVFVIHNSIQSQNISKQVIGTAGKTQNNTNLKISWTIGEPVVGLMTGGGSQIGNGFYQALNLTLLSVEGDKKDLKINVYPNPTSQLIYVNHSELNKFQIQITDLNGKQIFSGTLEKDIPLDISNYTKGIYFLLIESEESQYKSTYKIIKS
jgi:hypothetical protein